MLSRVSHPTYLVRDSTPRPPETGPKQFETLWYGHFLRSFVQWCRYHGLVCKAYSLKSPFLEVALYFTQHRPRSCRVLPRTAGRRRPHCRGGTAACPQPRCRCSSSKPRHSARRRRRRPPVERCGCGRAPPPRGWPPCRPGTTRAARRRPSAEGQERRLAAVHAAFIWRGKRYAEQGGNLLYWFLGPRGVALR